MQLTFKTVLLYVVIVAAVAWLIASQALQDISGQVLQMFDSNLEHVVYFSSSNVFFTVPTAIVVILFPLFYLDKKKKNQKISPIGVTIFFAVMAGSVLYGSLTYTAISGSELVVRDLYFNEMRYPIRDISFKIEQYVGRCGAHRNGYSCLQTRILVMHKNNVVLNGDSVIAASLAEPSLFGANSFLDEMVNRGAKNETY
jgi:hypothetical protein